MKGVRLLLQNLGIYGAIYKETRKDYPGEVYYNLGLLGFSLIDRFNSIFKMNRNSCSNIKINPMQSFSETSLLDSTFRKLQNNHTRYGEVKVWSPHLVLGYDTSINNLLDKFLFLRVKRKRTAQI